jgi:hypothetical protein
MTEFRVCMLADIDFELCPCPFLITYLFAAHTDGQYSAQCLHFGQGLLQFINNAFFPTRRPALP